MDTNLRYAVILVAAASQKPSSGLVAVAAVIAAISGLLALLGLVGKLSAFKTDPSGVSTLSVGGRTYKLDVFTGRAAGVTKGFSEKIYGSTTLSTSVSVDNYSSFSPQAHAHTTAHTTIGSHTIVHDQFFLQGLHGQERSYQFRNANFPMRDGHIVSVVTATRGTSSSYFLVHNRTLDRWHEPNANQWLAMARGREHTAAMLWICFIALCAANKTAGAAFLLLVLPWGLLISRALPKRRTKQFMATGLKALLAETNRAADAFAFTNPPETNRADELTKLAELATAGLLTEEEWTRAKELYLGKAPDARALTVEQLRQIHTLYQQGVLSQGEFNMKKWDILARR